jgi:hypothetical protein
MTHKIPWEEAPELAPTHYLDTRIHTDSRIFEEGNRSIFGELLEASMPFQ